MHPWGTPSEMRMDRVLPAGSDSAKPKHLQDLSGKFKGLSVTTCLFLDQSHHVPVTSWDLITLLHLTGKIFF